MLTPTIKTIKPRDKRDLRKLINYYVTTQGTDVDLNHIDISNITDMSFLFKNSTFNGDISRWNMSHVTEATGMFYKSEFTGDTSNWDLRNMEYPYVIYVKSNIEKRHIPKRCRSCKYRYGPFCIRDLAKDIMYITLTASTVGLLMLISKFVGV